MCKDVKVTDALWKTRNATMEVMEVEWRATDALLQSMDVDVEAMDVRFRSVFFEDPRCSFESHSCGCECPR